MQVKIKLLRFEEIRNQYDDLLQVFYSVLVYDNEDSLVYEKFLTNEELNQYINKEKDINSLIEDNINDIIEKFEQKKSEVKIKTYNLIENSNNIEEIVVNKNDKNNKIELIGRIDVKKEKYEGEKIE